MATYNPRTKWTHQVLFVIATITLGLGLLQGVAGAMTHPAPETMAQRQQLIAAQSEHAQRIRTLQQGELRVAVTDVGARF